MTLQSVAIPHLGTPTLEDTNRGPTDSSPSPPTTTASEHFPLTVMSTSNLDTICSHCKLSLVVKVANWRCSSRCNLRSSWSSCRLRRKSNARNGSATRRVSLAVEVPFWCMRAIHSSHVRTWVKLCGDNGFVLLLRIYSFYKRFLFLQRIHIFTVDSYCHNGFIFSQWIYVFFWFMFFRVFLHCV